MSWWWVLLVALVVVLVAFWLSWTASRLDRIHQRIEVARGSLDTWLLRRSGAALELACHLLFWMFGCNSYSGSDWSDYLCEFTLDRHTSSKNDKASSQ
jgi:hypothetical protein